MKIGRPRKYPSEGKRPTLTFRVRGSLYEKLRREAELSEKSMSEVIEDSLIRYFEIKDQQSNADKANTFDWMNWMSMHPQFRPL